MSKKNWLRRQQQNQQAQASTPPQSPDPHDDAGDSEDTPGGPTFEEEFGTRDMQPVANDLAAGQIYDDVLVPGRDINVLQLPVGYKLPAIMLEAPYAQSGKDWWIACILGESCTKVYVDAEMLATGKLRA